MSNIKLSIEERINWLEQAIHINDPMAKLAIESSWNYGKLQEIYNVMNDFSAKDVSIYDRWDVESAFAPVGFSYQGLKSLFHVFWEKGEFLSVLTRYLETSGGYDKIAIEYKEMYEDLVSKKEEKTKDVF